MNFTFDWNESFFLITCAVCLIIFKMLPKRFNSMATFLNWLFVIVFIEVIDYVLGAVPYDLYDFLDGPEYQFVVALGHLIIYPSCAYFFTYFYDKWGLTGKKLVLYILGWTIISVSFEYLCVLNNVLTYNNWNILLSIPTYPAACVITLMVFNFIKRNFVGFTKRNLNV